MSNDTSVAILSALLVVCGMIMGISIAVSDRAPTPSVTVVYDCNKNIGDAPPQVLTLCNQK